MDLLKKQKNNINSNINYYSENPELYTDKSAKSIFKIRKPIREHSEPRAKLDV